MMTYAVSRRFTRMFGVLLFLTVLAGVSFLPGKSSAELYESERYGFSFEIPESCEAMPPKIFGAWKKATKMIEDQADLDAMKKTRIQYLQTFQCAGREYFRPPYFMIVHQQTPFRTFKEAKMSFDMSNPLVKSQMSKGEKQLEDSGFLDSMDVQQFQFDEERKIVFLEMNLSSFGEKLIDKGVGFFKPREMVYVHFYFEPEEVEFHGMLLDQIVDTFQYSETGGTSGSGAEDGDEEEDELSDETYAAIGLGFILLVIAGVVGIIVLGVGLIVLIIWLVMKQNKK